MVTIKIKVTYEHRLNMGTAKKPDYKTAGDVIDVDKKVADKLISGGFAIYVNEKPKGKTKEESK